MLETKATEDAIEVCIVIEGDQVREIWSEDEKSSAKRFMFFHKHCCCIAGMMGPTIIDGVNDISYDNDNDTDTDEE